MPKIEQDLLDKLNQQVSNELSASHQYLAMAAWFEAQDLPGCAQWMLAQSEEERGHAMKFYEHINERDEQAELHALPEPETKFQNPVDVFEKALAHEQKVTAQIYQLYEDAQDQKDHALKVFLDWFVTEQVEEENTVEAVLERFRRVGDDPTGLLILDDQLAAREPPA